MNKFLVLLIFFACNTAHQFLVVFDNGFKNTPVTIKLKNTILEDTVLTTNYSINKAGSFAFYAHDQEYLYISVNKCCMDSVKLNSAKSGIGVSTFHDTISIYELKRRVRY